MLLNRPSMYGNDSSLGSALQRAYRSMSPVAPPPGMTDAATPPGYGAMAEASAPAAVTPPPPSPTASGRYPTNAMTPAVSTAGTPAPTQSQSTWNGIPLPAAGATGGGDKYSQEWKAIYDGVDPADLPGLNDYINFIKSLPTYKGSREAEMAAIALYSSQLKANRRGQGALDDHAVGMLGDEYNGLDDQMTAQLAAMGIDGPTLAGAHSNLRGKETGAVGNLLAQLTEQKRREALALQMQQLGFSQQMIQMAMQRYQQEHAGGGLLGDILGLVGTVGGAIVGGPGGATIGHQIGSGIGSFAGGSNSSAGYGNASYGGYGPPDPNAYDGPWQP